MKAQEWKLLGHLLFAGITLRGLVSKIPSTYVFLNVHSWQKPFQTRKTNNHFVVAFGLCCPLPVWLWRLKSETFGSFFFKGIPLQGLILKITSTYVVLNVHPWQKLFQTPTAKNYFIISLLLDFVAHLHRQYCLWRLKSENFWVTFFCRYTLAGSNIKNSIHIRGFERASLAKVISDPKGEKLFYYILAFGLCCPPPVLFMKAWEWKLLGHLLFVQKFHPHTWFWTCVPGKNHFRP